MNTTEGRIYWTDTSARVIRILHPRGRQTILVRRGKRKHWYRVVKELKHDDVSEDGK